MGFLKPTYFLMDASNKRIIICGEDEHDARWIRSRLGLTFSAGIYSGLTDYRIRAMKDWTRVEASDLLEQLDNPTE